MKCWKGEVGGYFFNLKLCEVGWCLVDMFVSATLLWQRPKPALSEIYLLRENGMSVEQGPSFTVTPTEQNPKQTNWS